MKAKKKLLVVDDEIDSRKVKGIEPKRVILTDGNKEYKLELE